MPTYDYKCNDCNYTFELFQKITEEPIERCPKCSGSVKRLIGTGAAPIFKGSGFYQTDYKNSSVADKNSAKNKHKNSNSSSKNSKKD